MSHLESGLLTSKDSSFMIDPNARTTKRVTSQLKSSYTGKNKLGKRFKKHGASTKGISSRSKLRKNGYILSEDSVTLRTPKPLFSSDLQKLANKKKELIDECRLEREKLMARPGPTARRQKNTMDSSNVKDSSLDRSSDSQKMGTSSQLDRTSYARSSETDNSEDDKKKKRKRRGKKGQENPNADVGIVLQETPTEELLYIPSMIVTDNDETEFEQVAVDNKTYLDLKKMKVGSDNYTEHAAQTLTLASKMKMVETEITIINNQTNSVKLQVNNFEEVKPSQGNTINDVDIEDLKSNIQHTIDDELSMKLKDPESTLPLDIESLKAHGSVKKFHRSNFKKSSNYHESDTSKLDTQKNSFHNVTRKTDTKRQTSKFSETRSATVNSKNSQAFIDKKADQFKETLKGENLNLVVSPEEFRMINSPLFQNNLKFMERILNQSKYHKEYISYRNYPEQDLKSNKPRDGMRLMNINDRNRQNQEKEKDQTPKHMKLLFKYDAPELITQPVTSLDFNHSNPDLLAATYGNSNLATGNQPGCVAFWTLKNPGYPERVIKTHSGAMSCKFSKKNPNLIGVGLYDGVVAIYDIRKPGDSPAVADSQELESKHLDAIWEVGWVGKSSTSEKGEGLISVSSDGKIMEWSIKKGLESQELKWLNRSANPVMKEESSDAINFRFTTGFSFDFLPNDTIFYLVATEDGAIHRCSKSYKDQYLRSYYAHTGPVYKVKCNPFWSNIFLSCSADWTCRVWNWEETNPKYTLRNLTLTDEVLDAEWSPYCSTLFASCSKDGRLELWDLKEKSLDPIHVDWDGQSLRKNDFYSPRTCLKFNPKDPILVSGDQAGLINVYRLFGYENYADQFQEEQQSRLIDLLYPAGYNNLANEDED